MYFILFDPIFWISKTLATFDRMVAKLQKQIDKVDAELDVNKGATIFIGNKAEEKAEKISEKTEAKRLRIANKAFNKKAKVAHKADKQINNVRARNAALNDAKRRASNAAKNISKLMED